MDLQELYKLFYIDKNYSGIRELVTDFSDFRSFNIFAKTELINGNINEAYLYFEKAQNIYGCAYCKFIKKRLDEAKILLRLMKESSSIANWLFVLISIVQNDVSENPTYFQIRNFYEQDLELLFNYKNYDYIQKILDKSSYFEKYNREIYKYSARVLLNNNHIDLAKKMLKKSLEILYNDPETHYLLGDVYLIENNLENAKYEFDLSSKVCGEYMPAQKKLKDLMDCII